MINPFETSTSNKSVQNGCSDLYGALNASGRYGQDLLFSGYYSTTAMTEMEMNGPFDY